MKKILLTGLCLLLFVTLGSYSYVRAKSDQPGMMNQPGGMMEHGGMTGDMMGMMHQMSGMMGEMSGMMKEMPAGRMKEMSGVMRDMSHQMMEMSKVMHRGKASPKEMKMMHERMTGIQKKMSEMGMKK
ncbi:MAG: hypothetical protein M0Z59_05750 [Nitrospiraceae bacterium]|nr:hypothetical protein [Nitrospiraceae bacterium]